MLEVETGAALAAILGLAVGSFLNVIIYRLPLAINNPDSEIDLINPKRSFCPSCEQILGLLELIPVFSFLFQKGKCKHCNKPIHWQYPFIEIVTALASGAVAFVFNEPLEQVFYLLLVWFLIPLFVIDLKEQLLPDLLTLPLMWIGFIYQMQFGSLQEGVVGAMLGYLILWVTFWLFKITRNKEGLGYGDFKLTAALGAWLGWQLLPQLIFTASMLGLLFFLISGAKKNQKLAFGPFLILGMFIVMAA